MRIAKVMCSIGLAVLGGCASMGPQRMGIDRSDYATHLRETNKDQMLLNIVAMRYGDAPLFLEVSSVISQYTREGSVSASVPIAPPVGNTDTAGVGGSVLLRETPTITYTPLSGDRFARSLLSPIPPASVLGLVESGWSIDSVFPVVLRSINGVSNGSRNPLFAHSPDPEFERVIAAMARVQRSRGLVLHVERGPEAQFSAHASLSPQPSAQDREDLAYLVRALNLPGDSRGEFKVAFGDGQVAPDTLTLGTRSMFEIFSEMAQGVEVPARDAQGRTIETSAGSADTPPLIRIHSGTTRPVDAHAAIRYRGTWFWIDGTDEQSKRMFLIAQIILSLNDTSGGANAPLVTIPTG
jgi:hypothetical protein